MQSYNECVQKLKDLAKGNNNLITFKQINENLPNDPIYLEKIADLINDLTDTGIEIIDETQKRITRKHNSLNRKKPTRKFKNKRYYDDPVRMYLGEMGRVPLLDREGEVRIAKKIESGQRYINKYVFMSGSTLREMENFYHRYQEKRVRLDHIFKIEYGSWMDKSQEERLMTSFKEVIADATVKFNEIGELLDESESDENGIHLK